MEIEEVKEEGRIRLIVSGRVDTVTSPKMEKSILNAFQKEKYLIIDMGDVYYISSAGLRTLLIGEKTAVSKQGRMELIHVKNVVREVLTMTGLIRILNVVDD